MGNAFSAPKLEKRDNSVEVLQPQEDTNIPGTARVPTGPADIYKTGLDDFASFLKGNLFAGNLEQRKSFQKGFVKGIEPMMRLDYPLVKEILDYFLKLINTNRDAFDYNHIVAPLYTVEPELPAQEVLRYKRFMLFIVLLAEHAKDRQRFIAGFDVVKFAAMFDEKSKQNITNYVYR